MRGPSKTAQRKKAQGTSPAALAARLRRHVTLEAHINGEIVAYSEGDAIGIGTFEKAVTDRVKDLRAGLPLAEFADSRRKADKELELLVRRLAARGLIEYRLCGAHKSDLVVIEPQAPDYWPSTAQLRDTDIVVLSRFAFLRRRDHEFVLESPRARALFKISDPNVAAGLALLSTPQAIKALRHDKILGLELLGLLLDSEMIFKAEGDHNNLRRAEGGRDLALWDFHDFLFHTRSTQGRHSDPIGGTYPHVGSISPLPAERPAWPGKTIDLDFKAASSPAPSTPLAKLRQDRHSVRHFDPKRPITIAELAQFLGATGRVLKVVPADLALDDGGHTVRPYPSAGASYELELYLAVDRCEGLARGFYHYDASRHALVPIDAAPKDIDSMFTVAQQAMGAHDTPQILITIAARFGRVAWKYSAIAYSLILKDVGVLTQSFYLAATDMGLGGCAIGISDIELFRRMTGLALHAEGPVGQFALGRPADDI